MGTHVEKRDRTLMVARILYEETDEGHPLPLSALTKRLAQRGVPAERKSLYRDLAALRRHGAGVCFRPGGDGGWYLDHRVFSAQELRALVDAVEVYPWMTEELRERLRERLSALAPVHQRRSLQRPVRCQRTGSRDASALPGNLDRIHSACQAKRVLSFFPLAPDGSREPETGRRLVSPKGLLWAREQYHLLGWDHRDKCLRLYRPEEMGNLLILNVEAQGPEVDPGLWVGAPFGLDPARRERVRLRCRRALLGEVLDSFGTKAAILPGEDGFSVSAEVVMGPAFWAWMSAHSEQAELVAPPWAARLWRGKYRLSEKRPLPSPKVV